MIEQTQKYSPLNYLPVESSVTVDTSKASYDEDEVKAIVEDEDSTVADSHNKYRVNAVNTLILEPEDQDESMKETLERMQRVAFPLAKVVGLLGIVAPETPEEIQSWARIHRDHAAVALDNKENNISTRLRNGAVVVLATPDLGIVDRFEKRQKIKARIESWNKLEAEVTPEQKALNNKKSGGGPSAAHGRVIAKKDWSGSLDGEPLQVGGITNRSPR